MWHNSLSQYSNIIQYDDDRILGFSLKIQGLQYLFINVYLPYFCADNENDYDMYIGKIASIVDSSDAAGILILGDFNANPNSSFYLELEQLCSSRDLIISDTTLLPALSFTHVNNGTLSRSWLDHCVCSHSFHNLITDIRIENEYFGSDHFPLKVTFDLQNLPVVSTLDDTRKERINWNFGNRELCITFYSILWQRLKFDPRCPGCACQGGCEDLEHRQYLDSLWNHFIDTAQQVGREVFGVTSYKKRCVPGWNDFVKDFYLASREAFKAWKDSGSPRFGPIACHMRRARAEFKYALRQCKRHENELRAMALSEKLQNGDVTPFWREIQTLGGSSRSALPGKVDDAVGCEEIVNLWKNKFSHVLNSVDDRKSKIEFLDKIALLSHTNVPSVTLNELKSIVKNLANNKAVGLDLIPNEFYKRAPDNILSFLSIILNAFLNHAFLPNILMHVLIVPLLKGKLKSPSESSNYRPIAIATAASKIFETLVFERIRIFLHTSDNQFGFKPHHSTEMCVYALKEVVNYYRSSNTPVFLYVLLI